jgi:hypothetical protein
MRTGQHLGSGVIVADQREWTIPGFDAEGTAWPVHVLLTRRRRVALCLGDSEYGLFDYDGVVELIRTLQSLAGSMRFGESDG